MATSEARAAWRPYEESEHQKSIHTQDQAHLETRDTDANVRSLDHTDVVCTVADREENRLLVLLHKLNDQGFLKRRHTTCTSYVRMTSVRRNRTDAQQITALHSIASSRNDFEISFSRANVRLLPSAQRHVSAVYHRCSICDTHR